MNIRCSITYSLSPYRNTLWAPREQCKAEHSLQPTLSCRLGQAPPSTSISPRVPAGIQAGDALAVATPTMESRVTSPRSWSSSQPSVRAFSSAVYIGPQSRPTVSRAGCLPEHCPSTAWQPREYKRATDTANAAECSLLGRVTTDVVCARCSQFNVPRRPREGVF